MLALIDRLTKGDGSAVSDFQNAVNFWKQFFSTNRELDDKNLMRAIGTCQMEFENALKWNRHFAKSIMSASMLASLYDEHNGFADNEDLARRSIRALMNSNVSIEVKGQALQAAALMFGLEDELNQN